MARISLRDYTHEIEDLIENGQNEEAIVHINHLLQEYPSLIAAHRLLGKAHLELGQDQEAATAFRQVLEAVPDDFIAHLGLSVIREHEGDLDASIRHMERAFDVQPANAIIQGELRRLHKERDGLEPQKIHLTRGALARMYAKGDLYTQAIAELRAALGEDPQRPDLQIVLAKMYARSGQLLEAAETCNSLLSKLPNCLEALYILGDILSRTDRSAEAQTHYQRAATLDPYAAQISPSQPDPGSVPDDSVLLDWLEVTPQETEAVPAAGQEWEKEEPVSLENEAGPDVELLEQSEEVELIEETSESGEVPFEPEETGETPASAIPDWMETAGWEPASGTGEETAFEREGEPEEFTEEEDELVKAEIPEWLKPLAPSEAEESAYLEAEGFEAPETSADWSGDLQESELQETGEPAEAGQEEGLHEWLETAEATQPEPEAETPDWLKAAEAGQPEPEAELQGLPETTEGIQPEAGEEMPDWLSATEAGQPEAGTEMPDRLKDEAEGQPEPEEELPDWLKAAEAEQTEPEEGLPDWLRAAEGETVGPEVEIPAEAGYAVEGARIFPYEPEEEPEEEEAGPGEIEEESAWEMEKPIPVSEAGTDITNEQDSGFPDWMQSEDEESTMEEQAFATGEPFLESSGEGEGTTGEPEVPEWLRSLGEESLAGDGETPAEDGEMPFLPEAEEPVQAEVPPEGSEVPDWLRVALEEQEQSQAEQPEDIPDWLRSSIPEGFPEEPPPILGDTKPVRTRPVEEEPEEETIAEEIQEGTPMESPEAEAAVAWPESEESLPEASTDLEEEAGILDLQEQEAYLSEEAGESGADVVEKEAAAMGWLESLAAREGAEEEELLTRPEERSEAVPEWLQKLAGDSELEEAEEPVSQPEGWMAEQPAESVPSAGELAAETDSWEPEEFVEAAESEEEATWQPEMEGVEEEVEEEAAWPPEGEVEAEETAERAEWKPEIEAESEEMVEQAASEAEMELASEVEAEPAEAAVPDAELPEWLRDFAEEDASLPAEEKILDIEPEAPPEEPLDLNTATLAQLERIPEIGYIQAQTIINYRDMHGPLRSREDLENVPGISPEVIERLAAWVSFEPGVEAPAPVEGAQEVVSEAQPDEQSPALAQAWAKVVAGEVPTAIDLYGDLIHKEQHLDQVIHELREAAFLYPQEISIHQALGDAYLRANRLQEALDAYNKAEDLLK